MQSLRNTNAGSRFALAGKAVADSAANSFAIARAYAPDYGKLAEVNMKARSQERQANTQAQATVTRAAMSAYGKVKRQANREQAQLKLDAINAKKNKLTRMAGRVAAAGQAAGGSSMRKPKRRDIPLPNLQAVPGKVDYTSLMQDVPTVEPLEYNPTSTSSSTSSSTSGSTSSSSSSENTSKPQAAATPYTGDLTSLSDKDKRDIAYIVSGEAARGTDDIYGVAGVVINRMRSDKYPSTAYDVGHQKGQFEAVEIGKATHEPELVEKLFSNEGLQKLESALKTLDGRDSFKGQALLRNRVAEEDPMFHHKGNFYHHSWQN